MWILESYWHRESFFLHKNRNVNITLESTYRENLEMCRKTTNRKTMKRRWWKKNIARIFVNNKEIMKYMKWMRFWLFFTLCTGEIYLCFVVLLYFYIYSYYGADIRLVNPWGIKSRKGHDTKINFDSIIRCHYRKNRW